MQFSTNSVTWVNDFSLGKDQATCKTFLQSNCRVPGCDSQGCFPKPQIQNASSSTSTSANVDSLSSTFQQLDLMGYARRELTQSRGEEEETGEVHMLRGMKLALDMYQWQAYQKCPEDPNLLNVLLNQCLACHEEKMFELQASIDMVIYRNSCPEKQIEEMTQIWDRTVAPLAPSSSVSRSNPVAGNVTLKQASTHTCYGALKMNRTWVDLQYSVPPISPGLNTVHLQEGSTSQQTRSNPNNRSSGYQGPKSSYNYFQGSRSGTAGNAFRPPVNSKNPRYVSSRLKEKSISPEWRKAGSESSKDSSRVRPHRLLQSEHAEDRIVPVSPNSAEGTASHQGQAKTELCKNWEENGNCPYTTSCKFAHGAAELRPVIRHPLYKTQVCRNYMEGRRCVYDHRCHFQHPE